MKIRELLQRIEYKDFIGDENLEVYDITLDSRQIDSSEKAFAAVKGFRTDGHNYIGDAIKKGARLIICQNAEVIEGISYIFVGDTRAVFPDAAKAILNFDSEGIKIIGVTGTNGKTSIVNIISNVRETQNLKTGTIGTMGVSYGESKIPLDNTTPEASEVYRIINEMKKNSIDFCAMEVSSHGLELYRVKNICFEVGIFTNLTEDHLIFHGDMESYFMSKKKLFYQSECALINTDDSYGRRIYKELREKNKNVYSYGIDNDADFKAEILKSDENGSKIMYTDHYGGKELFIKVPGKFNVYNYLASIAALNLCGMEKDKIFDGINKSAYVEGRFEFIENDLGLNIILDFAHTPDGLENVLKAISGFSRGKIIALFGAGGGRDTARRGPMGAVSGKYCDLTLITSDNPGNEDPEDICREIAKGVKSAGGRYKIIIDRETAVRYAIDSAGENDTVLFAGKSTEYYQLIKEQKIYYNERETIQNVLKNRKAD